MIGTSLPLLAAHRDALDVGDGVAVGVGVDVGVAALPSASGSASQRPSASVAVAVAVAWPSASRWPSASACAVAVGVRRRRGGRRRRGRQSAVGRRRRGRRRGGRRRSGRRRGGRRRSGRSRGGRRRSGEVAVAVGVGVGWPGCRRVSVIRAGRGRGCGGREVERRAVAGDLVGVVEEVEVGFLRRPVPPAQPEVLGLRGERRDRRGLDEAAEALGAGGGRADPTGVLALPVAIEVANWPLENMRPSMSRRPRPSRARRR